ncbi:MAG: hypothetical protein H0X43_12045 [Nitrosospira sp.]|nr:hypothetical protein [Nitrosospira sp.]
MRTIRLVCVAFTLLASVPPNSAWAGRGHGHDNHGHHNHGHHNHGHHHHRHHHHGGDFGGYRLGLGMGLLGYGLGAYGNRTPYYPPSYGYPPVRYAPNYYGYSPGYSYAPVITAPVVVPPAPPVYIQQEVVQAQPQAHASNYWHYCRNPEGYYPYVKNCPEGWLRVAPQPQQ